MSKSKILTIIHEMQASLEIHQWCQNQILNRFITSTENYPAKVHLPPSQPLSSPSYAYPPLPPPSASAAIPSSPTCSFPSPPLQSAIPKSASSSPLSSVAYVSRPPPDPQPHPQTKKSPSSVEPNLPPRSEHQWSLKSQSTPRLPIRHLSPTEINEKFDRGLCFNCDKKLSDTHRCRSKYLLLLGTDEDDDGYSKPPELHSSPPPTSPPTELPPDSELSPLFATPLPISIPPNPPPPIPTPPSQPPTPTSPVQRVSTTPPTTTAPPLLPIQSCNPAEIKENRDRGLGYNGNQKWSSKYRCRRRFLLFVGSEGEIVSDALEPRSAAMGDVDTVGGSSSFHSSSASASSVSLVPQPPPPARVQPPPPTLPPPLSPPISPPPSPPIVVLGIQWRQQLHPVTHNYADQFMGFVQEENKVQLKGDNFHQYAMGSRNKVDQIFENGIWPKFSVGGPNYFSLLKPSPVRHPPANPSELQPISNFHTFTIAIDVLVVAVHTVGEPPPETFHRNFPQLHLEDKVKVKEWGMIHQAQI